MTSSSQVVVSIAILLGACPTDGDADSDGICSNDDSCPFDAINDEDSDDICTIGSSCVESLDIAATQHGSCASYGAGRPNEGYCLADGACEICPCTCSIECGLHDACPLDAENDVDSDNICGDIDSCPYDAANDADSDSLCGQTVCVDYDFVGAHGVCESYGAGRYNHGQCVNDGVCGNCPCECGVECGTVDACPLDPQNDVDSDALCADEDSCPFDSNNDVDGDGVCAFTSCADDPQFVGPHGSCVSYAADRGNAGHCVEDGVCDACGCTCASECLDIDSCPTDSANDVDSDNICGPDESIVATTTTTTGPLSADEFVEQNFVLVVVLGCAGGLLLLVTIGVIILCVCQRRAAQSHNTKVAQSTTDGLQMVPFSDDEVDDSSADEHYRVRGRRGRRSRRDRYSRRRVPRIRGSQEYGSKHDDVEQQIIIYEKPSSVRHHDSVRETRFRDPRRKMAADMATTREIMRRHAEPSEDDEPPGLDQRELRNDSPVRHLDDWTSSRSPFQRSVTQGDPTPHRPRIPRSRSPDHRRSRHRRPPMVDTSAPSRRTPQRARSPEPWPQRESELRRQSPRAASPTGSHPRRGRSLSQSLSRSTSPVTSPGTVSLDDHHRFGGVPAPEFPPPFSGHRDYDASPSHGLPSPRYDYGDNDFDPEYDSDLNVLD